MTQSALSYPPTLTETGPSPVRVGAVSNSDGGLVINTEEFKGKDIGRSDTPETLLTDFTNRPDITILCDRCNIYVDIRNLPYHRAYHEALTTLNYRHPQRPPDVRSLLQRRNIVLRKLKSELAKENGIRPEDIRRINEAYELLKSDLEDVYEEVKQIHEKIDTSVQGVSLNCSPACAYAVGMCSYENRRWKSYMEDVKVYQDYFGEDRNKCYLAIFDGYHGAFAAERSGHEYHHLLLHEMAKFDSKTKSTTARNFADSLSSRTEYEQLRPETRDSFRVNLHQDSAEIIQSIMDMCYKKYDDMMKEKVDDGKENENEKKKKTRHPLSEKMHKAFEKTYLLMDILLSYGQDERSKVRWSGTSALTIVIHATKSKGGDVQDDKLAALEEETSGSERDSGKVKKTVADPEELGMIHVANSGNSRAVLVRDNKAYRLTKDHSPKNSRERKRVLACGGNFSDSEKDSRVNGVLSVTRGLGNHGDKKLKDCVIVDPYTTTVPIDQYAQFLVLASNGVWEVFTDEEVASLLVKMLPDQQIPPPTRFSDSLLPLLERRTTGANSLNISANNSGRSATGSQLQQQHQQQLEPPPSGGRVSFTAETREHDGKEADAEKPEENAEDKKENNEENKEKSAENQVETKKESNTLVVHGDDDKDTGTKNVLADLHTEIGSHMSDAGDVSLRTGTGQGDDVITLPEHSNYQEPTPRTEEELRRELAKAMAEHLTQAALLAGSKDNVTVMVVLLPACGI